MPKVRTSGPKRPRKTAPAGGERARAIRAMETALAALAHDIRTPLGGILALSELLAASELGERERSWALTIRNTAEYLASLTTLLVDAAKAEVSGLVLRRDPFSPRTLAEAVATLLAARAQAKGLQVEIDIASDLPAVVGDPVRLRAALENLADNAVKFTEAGRIAFKVTAARAARGRVRLVFCVTDSGIGLSLTEIKRLFRPFTQASETVARRFGGAGLGLVSVQRLAKTMGGGLKVTSAPGKGSTFTLSVVLEPAAGGAASDEGTARAHALGGSPARQLRVLCAEDNPFGRVILNTILGQLGHRADFVGSGEGAIEAVARGDYDAVLMDVTLSGLDGIEATRRIRTLESGRGGRIRIIGISGRTGAAEAAAARAAGMDAYLPKPITAAALAAALRTLAPAEGSAPSAPSAPVS